MILLDALSPVARDVAIIVGLLIASLTLIKLIRDEVRRIIEWWKAKSRGTKVIKPTYEEVKKYSKQSRVATKELGSPVLGYVNVSTVKKNRAYWDDTWTKPESRRKLPVLIWFRSVTFLIMWSVYRAYTEIRESATILFRYALVIVIFLIIERIRREAEVMDVLSRLLSFIL